jgi:hypothetical protein
MLGKPPDWWLPFLFEKVYNLSNRVRFFVGADLYGRQKKKKPGTFAGCGYAFQFQRSDKQIA